MVMFLWESAVPSRDLPWDLPPNSPVALDWEASGLHPDDGARISMGSVAWFEGGVVHPDNIRSLAFAFDQGMENKPWLGGQDALFGSANEGNLPLEEWQALIRWLKARSYIVMHNMVYDIIMAGTGVREDLWDGKSHGVDLLGNVMWDTVAGCHNLWPRHEKGLKPTAARLWGVEERETEEVVKAWLKKHKVKIGDGIRYDYVPLDIIGPYATKDAELTLRLWCEQMEAYQRGEGSYDHVVTVLIPILRLVVREERKGLPYHVAGSRAASKEVSKAKIEQDRLLPFLPTGRDAKTYFFGADDERTGKGIAPLGLTPLVCSDKTGEPSLDSESLRRMVEQDVPHARDWQLYTLLDRSQSMYYDGWAVKTGADGRLRARVRPFGTVSSRFSIGRANLQAMPKDRKLEGLKEVGLGSLPTPRQLIVKAVEETMPGWVLMEYDLSQAELRLGALLANCRAMLEAYHNDVDLHQYTADQIGCPRQVGKVANLSLEYGAGVETLGNMMVKMTGGAVQMPHWQLREVWQGYHRAYPELNRAIEKWDSYAQRRRFVPLVGGQRRYIRPGEDTRLGWNQVVQGSLAQYMLYWLLEVDGMCRREGIEQRAAVEGIGGAGLLMEIHDSAIVLMPVDMVEKMSKLITDTGIEIWHWYFDHIRGGVPLKIDGGKFKG